MLLLILCLFLDQSCSLDWFQPETPTLPYASMAMSAAYDKSKHSIWLLGGDAVNGNTGNMLQYNIHHNNITIHPNLLYQVQSTSQSYTKIENKLYIISDYGGSISVFDMDTLIYSNAVITKNADAMAGSCITNVNTNYLAILRPSAIYILDINTNEWQNDGPSLTQTRYEFACNDINNGLYAIGGRITGSVFLNTVELIDTTDILNISINTWTVLTDTLSIGRHLLRSVVYNDNIYVVGGWNGTGVTAVDIIDTNSKQISLDSHLITGVAYPTVVVARSDKTMFIFGGQASATHATDVIQFAELPPSNTYDPTMDPTLEPTYNPTADPSINPTIIPTVQPTYDPTNDPTIDPTHYPTNNPTNNPSLNPTSNPSTEPTYNPSNKPIDDPTKYPSNDPTTDPTRYPSNDPTKDSTSDPTMHITTTNVSERIYQTTSINCEEIIIKDNMKDNYFINGDNIVALFNNWRFTATSDGTFMYTDTYGTKATLFYLVNNGWMIQIFDHKNTLSNIIIYQSFIKNVNIPINDWYLWTPHKNEYSQISLFIDCIETYSPTIHWILNTNNSIYHQISEEYITNSNEHNILLNLLLITIGLLILLLIISLILLCTFKAYITSNKNGNRHNRNVNAEGVALQHIYHDPEPGSIKRNKYDVVPSNQMDQIEESSQIVHKVKHSLSQLSEQTEPMRDGWRDLITSHRPPAYNDDDDIDEPDEDELSTYAD